MMGTEIRTRRILADRGGEEPTRFAAQELSRYLERMCRVCVPVEEVEFPISAGVQRFALCDKQAAPAEPELVAPNARYISQNQRGKENQQVSQRGMPHLASESPRFRRVAPHARRRHL